MSLFAQKTERKKKRIIKAATTILSEKGCQGTTLDEIAATLLITKGSIYYYFENKQDLLYQCFISLLNESIANINVVNVLTLSYKERLHKAMVVHIIYLLEEKEKFDLLNKNDSFFTDQQLDHIRALRNKYEQTFDQMIAGGIEKHVFLKLDIKIARSLIWGAMNWMIESYSQDGEKELEEFAEMVATYLLRLVLDPEAENEEIENESK